MSEIRNCPICTLELESGSVHREHGVDAFDVTCPRCGRFTITGQLLKTPFHALDSDLVPFLSAHTRQTSESGARADITSQNWEELAEAHSRTAVWHKADKLLRIIAKNAWPPGELYQMDGRLDYPLCDAHSLHELVFLFQFLHDSGRITSPGGMGGAFRVGMTMEGWRALEELENHDVGSRTCFVAMWFEPAFIQSTYDGAIRPAVESTGFDPIIVARQEFNHKICDEIIAQIRRSKFVVADFTEHRGGVYFEAGFALGLGLPVIFTCRHDAIEKAHFDTNHYNHIVWSTPNELRDKLTMRIRATIT